LIKLDILEQTGKGNQTKYNNEERIRIADIDEPELNTPAGKRSKEKLERKRKRSTLSCPGA